MISSIPYGELLRIKRNNTRESDFQKYAGECLERFRARGYGEQTLSGALKKANSVTRSKLLEERSVGKSSDCKFRMITTFSDGAGELRTILRKNWNLLKMDPVIGADIPEHPMLTFRKARALRDSLTSSYIIKTTPSVFGNELWGFFPCGKCKACVGSKRVLTYEVPGVEKPRPIKRFITCSTQYTVYCLNCSCGIKYIGSTIHQTKIQILEHTRAIKNCDMSYPVARHFKDEHNSNRDLLTFFALDHVPLHPKGGDRVTSLRRLESRYIIDLQTKIPESLNINDELETHLGD